MAPYQPSAALAAPAANTAANAAPVRSLNFIIRALSLPSVLRPIDPAFIITRRTHGVSVTEATLAPQSHPPRYPGRDAIRRSAKGSTSLVKLIDPGDQRLAGPAGPPASLLAAKDFAHCPDTGRLGHSMFAEVAGITCKLDALPRRPPAAPGRAPGPRQSASTSEPQSGIPTPRRLSARPALSSKRRRRRLVPAAAAHGRIPGAFRAPIRRRGGSAKRAPGRPAILAG